MFNDPKPLNDDELNHKFALLCDAIERIFYAEEDDIEPYTLAIFDPPIGHTSEDARGAAAAAFTALGL